VRRAWICGAAALLILLFAGASQSPAAAAPQRVPDGLARAIQSQLGGAPTWATTASPVAGLSNAGGIPDGFGASVGMSADGTTAIVGGPGSENNALITPYGSAYIFHTGAPDSWAAGSAPVATLAHGKPNDGFGGGVALSGDGATAFVAFAKSGKGAIDVFHVASPDDWTSDLAPIATLTLADQYRGSMSASADGTTLIVGNELFHAASAGAWTTTSTVVPSCGKAAVSRW